jgi:hypothetical protein
VPYPVWVSFLKFANSLLKHFFDLIILVCIVHCAVQYYFYIFISYTLCGANPYPVVGPDVVADIHCASATAPECRVWLLYLKTFFQCMYYYFRLHCTVYSVILFLHFHCLHIMRIKRSWCPLHITKRSTVSCLRILRSDISRCRCPLCMSSLGIVPEICKLNVE